MPHSTKRKRAEGNPLIGGDNFVLALAAPRGSGKSYFVGKLLRTGLLKEYDHVVIMCPSLKFNDDYLEFKGEENVSWIPNVTREKVEALFESQERAMELVKIREREEPDLPILICPKTLLILDDCVDSGLLTFRGLIDKIAERGRHIDLDLMVLVQRISSLSRSVRINSTYFGIFSPFTVDELEQFVKQFVPKSKQKGIYEKVEAVFAEPYQFLILDNTERIATKKLKRTNADNFIANQLDSLS